MIRFSRFSLVAMVVAGLLTSACGFKRKKYENPITKDTQQPDKLLYDKSVRDIEKGRYELARLTLNTLINTYDTSEFLAKAKLAIADSWYREGGTHGMAQAEAEYKDFILFYPAMEEAAESQKRICDIHIGLMEKADRDPNNALRAEYECKQLWSRSSPIRSSCRRPSRSCATFRKRWRRTKWWSAITIITRAPTPRPPIGWARVVEQYPLFSRADFALWEEADSLRKMGKPAREKEGEALQKIVRDYPLSPWVEQSKKRLKELEMPIPEADPKAIAHMRFEQENRTKLSLIQSNTQFLKRGPDTHLAAKSGMPTMTNPKQSVPLSVPIPASTAATNAPPTTGVNDVTIAPVANGTSALDTKPDARTTPPANATPADPNAPKTEVAKPEARQARGSDRSRGWRQQTQGRRQEERRKRPPRPIRPRPTTKTTANQE